MTRLIAIVVALSLPASVFAKPFMDRSKHKPSGATGIEAAIDAKVIPEADGAYAITGFQLWMLEGRTCDTSAGVRALPGRENTKQTQPSMLVNSGACPSKAKNPHVIMRDGSNYFVRGVRVCTQDKPNTAERSIRGLKILYARVKPNGTVEKLDDPEVWVNGKGCDKWEERAVCPDNMIAVGFRAHKSDFGYRALGLKCAAVGNRPD